MKKIGFILSVIVAMLVMACATTQVVTPSPRTITAEAPQLVVGSRFVFRETNVIKKSGTTYTLVVEKKELYNAKPAYWVRIDVGVGTKAKIGDSYDIYNLELNWMATLKKGIETYTAWPCIKQFSWPLFVGKESSTNYRYDDKVLDRWWENVIDKIKVEDYEEVKVPASTFKAFKVKRISGSMTFTRYYAPSIGMMIKEEIFRSPESSLGVGEWMRELMEFSIPNFQIPK